MRAAVYKFKGRNSEAYLTAFAEGLRKHGLDVTFFNSLPVSEPCDFYAVWGWRLAKRVEMQHPGSDVVVVERGFIGDRTVWTSLGWNGLNGEASFGYRNDPSRFHEHFDDLLKPWRTNLDKRALLIHQLPADQSVVNIDMESWYVETTRKLGDAGWQVTFRPHPLAKQKKVQCPAPLGARLSVFDALADDLAEHDLVVTMNSTSGVEAILAGVPVHAEDRKSMVYDLASHDLTRIRRPRLKRLAEIAWSQWMLDEMSSGMAWDLAQHGRPQH